MEIVDVLQHVLMTHTNVSCVSTSAANRSIGSTVRSMPVWHSVLNVKAVVAAFNQENALVGAFSVIVQPVVEPMEHYTALFCMDQQILM